jgi:hypothetical protein
MESGFIVARGALIKTKSSNPGAVAVNGTVGSVVGVTFELPPQQLSQADNTKETANALLHRISIPPP